MIMVMKKGVIKIDGLKKYQKQLQSLLLSLVVTASIYLAIALLRVGTTEKSS